MTGKQRDGIRLALYPQIAEGVGEGDAVGAGVGLEVGLGVAVGTGVGIGEAEGVGDGRHPPGQHVAASVAIFGMPLGGFTIQQKSGE